MQPQLIMPWLLQEKYVSQNEGLAQNNACQSCTCCTAQLATWHGAGDGQAQSKRCFTQRVKLAAAVHGTSLVDACDILQRAAATRSPEVSPQQGWVSVAMFRTVLGTQ
jgi:hypothetical protein